MRHMSTCTRNQWDTQQILLIPEDTRRCFYCFFFDGTLWPGLAYFPVQDLNRPVSSGLWIADENFEAERPVIEFAQCRPAQHVPKHQKAVVTC